MLRRDILIRAGVHQASQTGSLRTQLLQQHCAHPYDRLPVLPHPRISQVTYFYSSSFDPVQWIARVLRPAQLCGIFAVVQISGTDDDTEHCEYLIRLFD